MYNKYERYDFSEVGCPVCASEEVLVTVPVAVRAYSNVGNVSLSCMGPAIINRNSDVTPGMPGAVSKFTVGQRIHVDVPIVFSAEADVGEGHVCFDNTMEGFSDNSYLENYDNCNNSYLESYSDNCNCTY